MSLQPSSFSPESEPQVFESEGLMDIEESQPETSNPQDPLIYIPLQKGRSSLPLERRLELLQQELAELDSEFDTQPQTSASHVTDPIAEMQELQENANTLAKALGVQTMDLTVKGEIPRQLAASITNSLSSEDPITYELSTSYPERLNEETLDFASNASRLASRISRLEGIVGGWNPTNGFVSVAQAVALARKTLSKLDQKHIKVLNSQAEDIKSELDMINYQKDMLLGSSLDQQVVEGLYDRLTDLNAVQLVLELMIKRMGDLKKVHEEGAEFKARLLKVAEQLTKAEQKLKETGVSELIEKWAKSKVQIEDALNASISS